MRSLGLRSWGLRSSGLLLLLKVVVLSLMAVWLAEAKDASLDANFRAKAKPEPKEEGLAAVDNSSQAGRMSMRVQPRRKMPPIALIASMDGSITAVKADTGSKLWSVDLGGPLLYTWQNRSVFYEHDIIPNTDGSLYLFSDSEARLQRLPITVQNLVEHSPFVADDGTVYVAQKRSQLMVVDRLSGRVLAKVASDSLDESYQLRSGEVGLLIGRYEYVVKAVDPYTNDVSWIARLSYIPSVRMLRPEGGILPPLPDPIVELDPGTYFYNQHTVYAVNRKTGEVSWWLDTAGPAVAVHVLGDHAVSDERRLLPSSAPLEGDVDLWRSRLLVSEDYQYVQVHNGQPFATNGVLQPLVDGIGGGQEVSGAADTRPGGAVDGGEQRSSRETGESWDEESGCCVGCPAYPGCLGGVHQVFDQSSRQNSISRSPDVPLLAGGERAVQPLDAGDNSAEPDLNFDQAVMSSLLKSAFGEDGVGRNAQDDANRQTIEDQLTPPQKPQVREDNTQTGHENPPATKVERPSHAESYSSSPEANPQERRSVLLGTWDYLVQWTASNMKTSEFNAEVGLFLGGVLLCLLLYIELGHRFNADLPKTKSGDASEDASMGLEDMFDKDFAKKRRKGGARGGKTLRRRKAAMERGVASSSGSFESAEEGDDYDNDDADEDTSTLRIRSLEVHSDEILGHGSQGTIVFGGTLDSRQVAVKRLLAQFFEVAKGEVDLLIKADAHPNVVRYFAKEQDGDFVYLALERCEGSLASYIDKNSAESSNVSGDLKGLHAAAMARKQIEEAASSLPAQEDPEATTASAAGEEAKSGDSDKLSADALPFIPQSGGRNFCEDPHIRQMIMELLGGVAYLHSLGIVHRDLKPGNVLLSIEGNIKISDMGLSKRLDKEQSSFETLSAGTIGWRAPELILGERCTKAVDIFAVGCIMHYLLTGGHHVFGERMMRDANIVRDQPDTSRLAQHPEARDLVLQLVRREPKQRPTAAQALCHPFFWSQDKCLRFLLDCSDRVENETPTSDLVVSMDKHGAEVFAGRWDAHLDPAFIATLLERRKYNYSSLRDLLRAIRNKKNHFRELPQDVQTMIGTVPDGYMQHFRQKFPCIVLAMYSFVKEQQFDVSETIFQKYFAASI